MPHKKNTNRTTDERMIVIDVYQDNLHIKYKTNVVISTCQGDVWLLGTN